MTRTTSTATAPTKRARPAVKAAPAKKTPVKRVTAAKTAVVSTDEVEPPAVEVAKPGTIRFRGRTMPVKALDPAQLGMWALVMKRLRQSVKTKLGDEDQARLLAQTIEMISSVLADTDDVDWVETEMLAGRIKLEAAIDGIMGKAAEATNKGAKTAPRTGPQPKARRAR